MSHDKFESSAEYEIALPQLPHDLIRSPYIEMEDILAIQSLTMGYLRWRSRTRVNDEKNKRYGLCMFDTQANDDPDVLYEGNIHTYMTTQLKKPARDQWHMTVNFRESLDTEATNYADTHEKYIFDWLRNGNRAAWYTKTQRWDDGEGIVIKALDAHPLTSEETDNLQQRMLDHSERVNPMAAGSIYLPATE